MKRLKSSSCNAVFFMILIFAALQVLFNIFPIKWRVKWRPLWNSSYKFEFTVFNFKWLFLFFLKMVIFTRLFWRWPTLWNSTLKRATLFRCCLTLFISTLKYTQRSFDLVQRYLDVISTKRQRWNNVKTFAGIISNFVCFNQIFNIFFR